MAITVYPYFTEDIYLSHKYRYFSGVHVSESIKNILKNKFNMDATGIFVAKTDCPSFLRMRHKKDTEKIFEVNAELPDGTIIPCSCLLSVTEEYNDYFEDDRKVISGKIIANYAG